MGGFLSTGSAGGTLQYSTHENVHALRFVDGNGEIFEVSRNDTNQDNFNAALISLGLLGVLSQVSSLACMGLNIILLSIVLFVHVMMYIILCAGVSTLVAETMDNGIPVKLILFCIARLLHLD